MQHSVETPKGTLFQIERASSARRGRYPIKHWIENVEDLDKFAEIGIDGLNVLEGPPMGDVEMADAKRRIGGRVCLCGNIEYDPMERGTPEEIEAKVNGIIEQAGVGGGLIVSPTASPYNPSLSPQTERNYIAMIQATRNYGRY